MSDISSITHSTTATGTDSADQVSVSQWNDGHNLVGVPRVAEVTLTNAQLLAIDTTHIQIVPSPGAGKWIYVVSACSYFKYGSAGFDMNGADPTIGYGNGWNPFNGNLKVEGLVGDNIQTTFNLTSSGESDPAEMVDKALNVEQVGTLTGGVGCSLKVSVVYVVLDALA